MLLFFGKNISSRAESDLSAIQVSHREPTSRLGGLAIILGISTIFFSFEVFDIEHYIFCSVFPVFIFGLLEDIHGNINAKTRFLAAGISAILAIFLTGLNLSRVDVELFDAIIIFPLFGMIFTVFASSGLANSFNLIDGINGFCSIVSFTIACSLGLLGDFYDEKGLSYLSYMIAISLIPFILLNYPFGLIFLGDAGAYSLGHLLCWIAIVLVSKNLDISTWAILLIFFWPVTDTAFTIIRRRLSKVSSSIADSMHFHQLVMRFFELRSEERSFQRRWANPLSTLILLPFALFPIYFAFLFIENKLLSTLTYLIFLMIYLSAYLCLIKILIRMAEEKGKTKLLKQLRFAFKPQK